MVATPDLFRQRAQGKKRFVDYFRHPYNVDNWLSQTNFESFFPILIVS